MGYWFGVEGGGANEFLAQRGKVEMEVGNGKVIGNILANKVFKKYTCDVHVEFRLVLTENLTVGMSVNICDFLRTRKKKKNSKDEIQNLCILKGPWITWVY